MKRKQLRNRIFTVLCAASMLLNVWGGTAVYGQGDNGEAVIEEETAEESRSSAATLVWPVPGHTNLSQGFHDGKAIDISDGSIAGATVCAALGGTVTNIFLCGNTHYNAGDCNGFGTGLVIRGDDGRFYQYAHMQAGSIPANVYRGARVEAGAQLGRVGTTGFSYGYHLHFGISTGNYWNYSGINPQNEVYTYGNAAPAQVTMSWQNDDCQPGETNARIAMKAVPSVRGTFTQAGAVVWDAAGTEVASKTENISTPGSYLDVWYDITGEMGAVLRRGSVYRYQFFVVFNGTRYTSTISQFTTAGSEPVAVNVSWENDDCQPGETNARIAMKAVPSVRGTFTQAGAVVKDAVGNEAASKTENINTEGSYLDIWYDITDEMGAVLKSGSAYTYQFFVVFNGTRYTGPEKNFSTTEPEPEPEPEKASVSWDVDDCTPSETNAEISIKALPSIRGTFTQAGAVVWDASGAETASKTEDINITGSYLDIWYDITGEMGAVLKSGSAYTYQFFLVFNGEKYTSPIKEFSTLGQNSGPDQNLPSDQDNQDNEDDWEDWSDWEDTDDWDDSEDRDDSNEGEYPDYPDETVCDHVYSQWETVSEATVFEAEEQERVCELCGELETRTYGTELTPTIQLNTTSITLKTQQSTSKVKVSGLAAGDFIQDWRTSNSSIATVNSAGKIAAKKKTGSAVVTVTLASGLTGKINVKVQKGTVQTTRISGLKKSITLKMKKKTTLKPVISPVTSTQKVTYKSSNTKVAAVSSSGRITAKRRGRAAITVKSGRKSFKVSVTVK